MRIDTPYNTRPWPFTNWNTELRCKCYQHTEPPFCFGGTVDHRILIKFSEIREIVGRPIHITSGYRCPRYNIGIKDSSPNSWHLKGMALDLALPEGFRFPEFSRIVQEINGDGGTILYPNRNFIHIDRGNARYLINEGS